MIAGKLAVVVVSFLTLSISSSTQPVTGRQVSPHFGLLVRGTQVLARDHGRWRDITPPGIQGSVWSIEFLNEHNGWIFAGDCALGGYRVYRTHDGGRSWHATSSPAFVGCHADDGAQLDFVDARHGWLTEIAATAPFAHLYRTTDGGATWTRPTELPMLGRIGFSTAHVGWAGAAATYGDGLYRTRDAGATWRRAVLERPATWAGAALFPEVPIFFGRRGVVAAALSTSRRSGIAFYTTNDRGLTWTARSVVPLGFRVHLRRSLFVRYPAVSIVSPDVWWVVNRITHPQILVTSNAGQDWTARSIPLRTYRWFDLSAADNRSAWVTAYRAFVGSLILTTSDGGHTWRRLTPPTHRRPKA